MPDSGESLMQMHSLLRELPAYEQTTPRSFTLSVLVPVYNERHLVAASLRRLMALEHASICRLQVVVVDDHSSDGTWEILQRIAAQDNRIVLLRHTRNCGK